MLCGALAIECCIADADGENLYDLMLLLNNSRLTERLESCGIHLHMLRQCQTHQACKNVDTGVFETFRLQFIAEASSNEFSLNL